MTRDKKQCEICAWPLECSPAMKAKKPAGADCPREARVWDRRVGEMHFSVDQTAPLEAFAEADNRQLMLV
jgi:hypothetical protein